MKGNWIKVETLLSPCPRSRASLAYDHGSKSVILFGGLVDRHGMNDTWSFDGTHWSELTPRTRPSPRHSSPMTWSPLGSHLVLLNGVASQPVGGGSSRPGTSMDNLHDTWVFDGQNWVSQRSKYPDYSQQALATDLASGLVVAFGGLRAHPRTLIGLLFPKNPGQSSLLDETWVYDGNDWKQISMDARPPGRNFAGMTSHTDGRGVVLFGGQGNTRGAADNLHDTWVFDGQNWEEIPSLSSPGPRLGMLVAHDPIIGRTVLFGGRRRVNQDSQEDLNDTWVFDGQNWEQVRTPTAPSPRAWAAMTFDAMNGQIVLFGGTRGPGFSADPLDETWILVIEVDD